MVNVQTRYAFGVSWKVLMNGSIMSPARSYEQAVCAGRELLRLFPDKTVQVLCPDGETVNVGDIPYGLAGNKIRASDYTEAYHPVIQN